MKSLKAICATTILALALSISAYAGEISTPGVAGPGETHTPPGVTAPGDVSTPGFMDIFWALAMAL